MTLRIDERVHHHTPEQVEAAVEESLAIADRLELSEADRATLLPGILNLLSAVHLQMIDTSLLAAGRRLQ